MDMYIDMCICICGDSCVNMYIDLCLDMCAGTCIDVCVDTCIAMHICVASCEIVYWGDVAGVQRRASPSRLASA